MLKFALVGCGGMANWHAQQLQKLEEADVVALVDNVPAQTRLFKEKYFPEAAEYESYDKMLQACAGKIDAVALITPHTLHYPQAKAALEKGMHVLVEKPMVTSSEHAYDLWRTVNKSGKMLGITFQSPYSREFGYLARLRDEGKWGQVQLVTGWLSQAWKFNTAGKWRQDPKLSGGGQMYDSGAHLLNAIMWLMNDPVVEVACFYDKSGTAVDINGVAIAKFQNGAMASITIGGNCPTFRTELSIQTDQMLIVTDAYGSNMEIKTRAGMFYPLIEEDDRPAAGTPHRNFVQAVLGHEPLRSSVRYGVLLSALMDAMYESGDAGKPVQVAPVPKEL